jgi:beta-lactam-binding protein with PASTA domain
VTCRLTFAVLVALLATVMAQRLAPADPAPRYVVPNLVGKSPDEARAMVRAAGFEYDLEVDSASLDCGEHPPKVANRHILCQKPVAGTVGDRNTIVYSVTYAEPRKRDEWISKEQLASLRGLKVGDAKAKLAEWSFDGKLKVMHTAEFDADCGVDKVCGTWPNSGVHWHEKLTLYINEKAEISAPP